MKKKRRTNGLSEVQKKKKKKFKKKKRRTNGLSEVQKKKKRKFKKKKEMMKWKKGEMALQKKRSGKKV